MGTFKTFFNTQEKNDTYGHAVSYMASQGVDIKEFHRGLSIVLKEWGYNPFKAAAGAGATGAGAVVGSAFGPVGTALGGMAGNLIGKGTSALAGKVMKGATTTALAPEFAKVKSALNDLNNALAQVATPEAAPLKTSVQTLQTNLDTIEPSIATIDKKESERLDSVLNVGGGWAGKLKNVASQGFMGKAARALGSAMEKVPMLKQDMGLRRAMAKGMDSLQAWAKDNPKKAAMLNAAAGIGGAALGGLGAGAMGGGPQAQGQPESGVPANTQQQVQAPQAGDQIASSSETSPAARDFIPNRSGSLDEPVNQNPVPTEISPDGKKVTASSTDTYGPDSANRPTMREPGRENIWQRLTRKQAARQKGTAKEIPSAGGFID